MKYLIIILSILFLLSCSKQKEQFEKIVFDARQINSQTLHTYTFYPSGKIKTTQSVQYFYKNGSRIDSLVYEKTFFYNNKGRIIRIEEDNTNEYYLYNNLDSLIVKYSVNSFGDTSFLDKISYKDGRVNSRLYRRLAIKFEENLTTTDLRNYDTIFDEIQYHYLGDSLEVQVFKDLRHEVTAEINTYYSNGKRLKAIHYNFLGDLKYVQNTTIYDLSELENPDYVDVNPSGDTTGFQKTNFKDSVRIVSTFLSVVDTRDYSFYNMRNQLIKSVMEDLPNQRRDIFTYLYDSKGNLIEETHFTERIVEKY